MCFSCCVPESHLYNFKVSLKVPFQTVCFCLIHKKDGEHEKPFVISGSDKTLTSQISLSRLSPASWLLLVVFVQERSWSLRRMRPQPGCRRSEGLSPTCRQESDRGGAERQNCGWYKKEITKPLFWLLRLFALNLLIDAKCIENDPSNLKSINPFTEFIKLMRGAPQDRTCEKPKITSVKSSLHFYIGVKFHD